MKKLVVNNFAYVFGGDESAGWLPANASRPNLTPVEEVIIDVAIEEVEGGALLIYTSQDGVLANDYWYESIPHAIDGANEKFGIHNDAWKEE